MSNLMKYEWYELRHNSILWLAIVVLCVFGFLIIGPGYLEGPPMVPNTPKNIQGIFMASAADSTYLFLIIAGAFTAMLLGQQFSNRTIDNELAAGHSRAEIFAARSIICFIVPNVAILLALFMGILRCSFTVPWPSALEAIPYFARTIGLLLLLNFSLASACIFFVVLFRDTAKSMAISAVFLLLACWTMPALQQTAVMVPGTLYTNTPGIALLLHPAFLMRYILRPNLSLAQGVEAIAVAIGWSIVFQSSAYCVFRRCELK